MENKNAASAMISLHCVSLSSRFWIAYFCYWKFWLLTPELGNFDVIMQNKQFIAAKNNEKKLERSSVTVEIIWTMNWDILTLGVSRFANSELEIGVFFLLRYIWNTKWLERNFRKVVFNSNKSNIATYSSGPPHWKWYFVTKIVLTYCEKKLF